MGVGEREERNGDRVNENIGDNASLEARTMG